MAESAGFLVEQFARWRIVQIDRMVVWKHERDPAERVVLAGQLANGEAPADSLHLIAAPAQGAELRHHLLPDDRLGHLPGRVDEDVAHDAGEDRRRRLRLADD